MSIMRQELICKYDERTAVKDIGKMQILNRTASDMSRARKLMEGNLEKKWERRRPRLNFIRKRNFGVITYM